MPDAPFFQQDYRLREPRYAEATYRSFGGTEIQFRSVAQMPGLSWRTAALGLTLAQPAYSSLIPVTARSLVLPVGIQASYLVQTIAVGKRPAMPWYLWPLELMPEALFMRLTNYAEIAWQAALDTWDRLVAGLRQAGTWAYYQSQEFMEAGGSFLGTVQTMGERFRHGGLLPQEWEKVEIWLLGTLSEPARSWLRRLLNRIRAIFHRPPEAVLPPGVTHQSRFHLFGLEVKTSAQGRLVARSTMGVPGAPAFWCRQGVLSSEADLWSTLEAHAAHWRQEHERRQKVYQWSGFLLHTLLRLVLRYIVMGPVGMVLFALHLIGEGLLRVVKGELHWPPSMPEIPTRG